MIKGILTRLELGDKQTLGDFRLYDGIKLIFSCKTLELPWLDNKKNISCIPEGDYTLKPFLSPSKGEVYLFKNVDNRTFVEVHTGNYYTDILGCVLLGSEHVDINKDGLKDVTLSRRTNDYFLAIMKNRELILTIKTL